jgi:cytochrome c-type biogenesis protein CcmH/NrfG
VLQRARQGLAQGDFKKAAKDYGTVIRKRYELDQVINDLRVAADHFPSEATLWQLLGDAYMRADRAEEAVEAYNRGMKAA